MVVDDGGRSKERSRAVLLVLCGLPGAGKTTLARRLEAWLREEEEAADGVVHYVGFDAIEAGLRSPEEGWSLDAWHAARAAAFQQAEQHLQQGVAAAAGDEGLRHVVILDDNMYYRSMRREAYKLAAKCGAGYACVWMDAPFALALKRCASRSAEGGLHVDEAVVRRMDQRLEPPDSGSHTWEGNSMRVEVRGAGEEENSDVVEAGTRAAVLACIEAGWREPATIPQPDSFSPEELEAVRRQTRESALQATELALRKMVGGVMMAAVGSPGEQKTSLGHALSQAKAKVWKEVCSGHLTLLNPLLEETDATNASARRALAARLLTVVVQDGAPPAFRAWVEELWAEAGFAVA